MKLEKQKKLLRWSLEALTRGVLFTATRVESQKRSAKGVPWIRFMT